MSTPDRSGRDHANASEDRAPPISGELVLEFHGPRVETEDEVAEIEDALVEILADGDALAGHEIAPEARRILIATRDAAAALCRVLPFLEQAGLVAELRAHARADGADTSVPLWPPHRP